MKKERGFTLTELLIVIAIIGILAGVILVSGGRVRQDARDKRRKADLEQIAGLLQIMLAQEKKLPVPSDSDYAIGGPQNEFNGFFDASYAGPVGRTFVPFLLDKNYATSIPLDPYHPSTDNFYLYHSYGPGVADGCSGPYFILAAKLEGQGSNTTCYTYAPLLDPSYYIIVGR